MNIDNLIQQIKDLSIQEFIQLREVIKEKQKEYSKEQNKKNIKKAQAKYNQNNK
jgi:hypothetical protein